MKILYLSNSIPYDGINHAGGKTLNYYIKKLSEDPKFEITVIGICKEYELKNLSDDKHAYDCYPIVTKGNIFLNAKRVLLDLYGVFTKKESYGQSYYKTYYFIKNLEKLKQKGYTPDVIFLEWTNCVLMVEGVKQVYPKAKIIASEYDVAFLGLEREYKMASASKKSKMLARYKKYKKLEIQALKRCDFILPESIKDKNLLVNEGIEADKIGVLVPYFHDMRSISRKSRNHDLLFWGAMYRPENYNSVIWFIDNVMPLLSDTDIRFVIAGNKPPKELIERENDKIVITGFVENEIPLFEQSMCLVSPLLYGAGIKVKIIEALSAGIPIVTNSIGIEGIPAEDKKSYFHCETPKEYENTIRSILYESIDLAQLKKNQQEIIDQSFNLTQSFEKYKKLILNIGG